jgi:serine/threonine protein kinase
MLSGHPPWYEFETMAAIFKIATSDWPQYELPSSVSEAAEDFVRRCFQKDPQQRMSAEELLRHRFCRESS